MLHIRTTTIVQTLYIARPSFSPQKKQESKKKSNKKDMIFCTTNNLYILLKRFRLNLLTDYIGRLLFGIVLLYIVIDENSFFHCNIYLILLILLTTSIE